MSEMQMLEVPVDLVVEEEPNLPVTEVDSKVGATVLGGAVSVLVLWGIGLTGVTVPLEVGGAITALIGFVFGYAAKRSR